MNQTEERRYLANIHRITVAMEKIEKHLDIIASAMNPFSEVGEDEEKNRETEDR